MGLFSKAKSFFGGQGAADVQIQCKPFGIGGGANILSGTMSIAALRDCTLLATKHEVVLRWDRGEEKATRLLGASDYPFKDLDLDIEIKQTELPRTMAAGDSLEHAWSVRMEIDDCLRKLGFSNPLDALGRTDLKVEVRGVADFQGSPFDPSATIELELERSPFAPK